jgi:hypothetical protein
MKIKWGALVVDGRNKIGGHVASSNRGGAYLRTKVSPKQPRTTYQTNVRAVFSAISSAWKSLTAANQRLWNDAVANYKKSDIFGDIKSPSGFNLYQKLNNNLTQVGIANITTPPLPIAVTQFTSASLAAVHAGAITLTYAPAIPAGEAISVRATPAISPGKNFVKSEFRTIGKFLTADASPLVITTQYNAKYGAVGAAGEKIFVKVEHISTVTGQASQSYEVSCIIS